MKQNAENVEDVLILVEHND